MEKGGVIGRRGVAVCLSERLRALPRHRLLGHGIDMLEGDEESCRHKPDILLLKGKGTKASQEVAQQQRQ